MTFKIKVTFKFVIEQARVDVPVTQLTKGIVSLINTAVIRCAIIFGEVSSHDHFCNLCNRTQESLLLLKIISQSYLSFMTFLINLLEIRTNVLFFQNKDTDE